ncbi:Fic/DOC family protein [Acholeplasma hippikon]|uniref:protein adenylyltransferase n=1 Tax=Acholeplasma hippikon TaxID=264636 RepID=A0A449BL05_9MOLU|nr:Fic family protein [Acholeplasma hippikon]VEU83114.1 Probable adenosine monophosphate-protein transferase fic [Acholeplasma hippikon]
MIKDPYLYPGTNVHINVAGIQDKARLKEYTAKQFALALIKLQKEDFEVKSSKDLLTLHKILFKHVFEWAGKIRIMNVTKSEFILGENTVEYADYTLILKELDQVDQKFMNLSWKSFTKEEFVDNLTNMIVSLWVIRPFREGNTRTIMVFLDFFIKKYGYCIDLEEFKRQESEIRNALVWATIGEFYHINSIFNLMLSNKCVTNQKK